MRKLIIPLLIILGIFFFIANANEMESVFETILQGDLRYIFFAFFLQIMWLTNIAASYRNIYRALGIEENILRLLTLSIAAAFVNVVTPSGIIGGTTVFIADARIKGHSTARITLASMLFLLFEYLSFLVVLGLGIIVLIRRNNLSPMEIGASGILLFLSSFMVLLLYLGMKSEESLGRLLARLGRWINRIARPFIKRNYLDVDRAYTFSVEASAALRHLRDNPRALAGPAALAMSNKALMISIFFMMFLAFKVPFSPGTLIAGYAIGFLFTLISPSPSGIGFVEGILTLTLRSFFIPLGSAAIVTLAYRGFTLWMPLIYGMVAIRKVGEDEGEA